MLITILGKRWRLKFVKGMRDFGHCDPPDKPGKEIRIRASLKGETLLATVLHELTHGAGWHLDEDYVEQFSNDVARILTRMGYRLNETED